MSGEGLLSSSKDSAFSLCLPPHGGRDQGSLWGLFYKVLILFTSVPLSWLYHFPRASVPNTITWGGGRISTYDFFFLILFIWLYQVLVVALGFFSCGIWDLVPWTGIEPGVLALGAPSFSCWTSREVPTYEFWRDAHIYSKLGRIVIFISTWKYRDISWYLLILSSTWYPRAFSQGPQDASLAI